VFGTLLPSLRLFNKVILAIRLSHLVGEEAKIDENLDENVHVTMQRLESRKFAG